VLRAKWFLSPYAGPLRYKIIPGDPREFEVARAYCDGGRDGIAGRRCGGIVGIYFIEDAGWLCEDFDRRIRCFRLPGGFVHRDGHPPFGVWEQSRRAAQNRPIRHKPSEINMGRAMDQAGGIPGVLRLIQTGPRSIRESFTFLVDPQATGGFVAIRCPNCQWLDEVPPVPPVKHLGFSSRGSGSV
jgi:hypothetical protein